MFTKNSYMIFDFRICVRKNTLSPYIYTLHHIINDIETCVSSTQLRCHFHGVEHKLVEWLVLFSCHCVFSLRLVLVSCPCVLSLGLVLWSWRCVMSLSSAHESLPWAFPYLALSCHALPCLALPCLNHTHVCCHALSSSSSNESLP